jgi:serine/threonine-protein kinase
MSNHLFQAPSPEYLAGLLPQYDVKLFIAQGGMGAVYKGRQISLDRDIAIKVLPHEVGASEGFRESFISEAKSMARLNHTNLLGVLDYGTVEGLPYIVMEYVEGGSLHDAFYNRAVEAIKAAVIVKGICDGLRHAHEHGIVHRDMKPSNILLTTKREPKIADFGLAHATDSDKPGLMMGTPGYTAPEVFRNPNLAGALADIYSVGVIMHQLLTGIDPTGSMTPPTHTSGNIRLDPIWRKATNPVPSQRYATVAAMSADLEKWIEAKQKSALTPAARTSSALARPAPVQTSSGSSTGKFFLIGVLGVMIMVAYLVLKDRKEQIDATLADNGKAETPAPYPEPEVPDLPVSLPPVVHAPSPKFAPEADPPESVPKATQGKEAIIASRVQEMAEKLARESEAKRAASLAPPAVSAPPVRDFTPGDAEKMRALKANGPASVTGVLLNLRVSATGQSLYFEFSKLTNPAEIMAVALKNEYQDDFTTDAYKDLIGKKVRFDGTVFREPTGKQYVKISARARMKIVE